MARNKPNNRRMDIMVIGRSDTIINRRLANFRLLREGDDFAQFLKIGYVLSAVTPKWERSAWWRTLSARAEDKRIHFIDG
jgi:hypothetical protein